MKSQVLHTPKKQANLRLPVKQHGTIIKRDYIAV